MCSFYTSGLLLLLIVNIELKLTEAISKKGKDYYYLYGPDGYPRSQSLIDNEQDGIEHYSGQNLVRDVLRNNSRHFRPVSDQAVRTTVQFRLLLYQILGANSIQGKIHLHFWVEMLWNNEHISWTPDNFFNISRIDLNPHELWIPDIIFFTQLSGSHFNQDFPSQPALLFDGMTMVLKPFRTELVCVMDVWFFPYDRQVCEFDVGSWAHTSSEVDIRPKEEGAADMMFFQKNAEFDVLSFTGRYKVYKEPHLNSAGPDIQLPFVFNDTSGHRHPFSLESREAHRADFSCLSFSLVFERKPTYYLLNVILPSVLINFLCVFNFLIPCETGEKVTYGMTVFLAQSVNLMVVSEMVPQGGISVLGLFLLLSLFMIALSLLMQVLTMCIFFSSIHCRASPLMRRMGEQMRKLVGPKGPYNLLNNIYCPQPISPLVYNSVEANQEDKERVYMTSELGSKKESGAPSPETEAFLPNGGNNQTANISSWVKNGSTVLDPKEALEAQWLAAASQAEVNNIKSKLQEASTSKFVHFNEKSFSSRNQNQRATFGIFNHYTDYSMYNEDLRENDRPMTISTARRRSSGFLPSDIFQYDFKQIEKQRGSVAVCTRYSDAYSDSDPFSFGSSLMPTARSRNGRRHSLRGDQGRPDSQIIFEWRLLANIQNRVNTLVFVIVLAVILILYYYFHAPPPLNSQKTK